MASLNQNHPSHQNISRRLDLSKEASMFTWPGLGENKEPKTCNFFCLRRFDEILANLTIEQMQFWQECNDTSTQLVNKTTGEICDSNLVGLVSEDVNFCLFISFCWLWQICFTWSISLPASRGHWHITVPECRATEDGEEKCNCWKVPN